MIRLKKHMVDVKKIKTIEKLKKALDEYIFENHWNSGSITFHFVDYKVKKVTPPTIKI